MRKIIQLCVVSLLIQPVFAYTSTQPKYCPGVEAIKAVPLKSATESSIAGWVVYNPEKNKFDTNDEWTFLMIVNGRDVHDKNDALGKANKLLPAIQFGEGPNEDTDNKGSWSCTYLGGDEYGFIAVAVTPAYEGLPEIAARFRR